MAKSNTAEEALSLLKKIKKQPERKELDERQWQKLINQSSLHASGAPKIKASVQKDSQAFIASEKKAVFVSEKISLPNWLLAYISSKKSPEQTFKHLLERLEKAPTTNGFHLALWVINDLFRKRGNTELHTKILDQETVTKFINLSQPKS